MPIDPRSFKAPFMDQQQCWAAAERFRHQYWPSGEVPVDVVAIAEFDLDLSIRTVTGLKQDADADALLLGDWKTLVVDQQQYMEDRFINRLRFSIAHELGHFVLHRAVFAAFPRSSIDQWLSFMRDMPEREYSFLEYHAYEFAGRLLVPLDVLKAELEKALLEMERSGLSRTQLGDGDLSYLCNPLAKHFAVSPGVIERRLSREKLWPF